MKPDTLALPCLRCGKNVVVLADMAHYGTICEACTAAESHTLNEANRVKNLIAMWNSWCPKAYQDTQVDKLPFREQSEKAMRWPKAINGLDLDAPWKGLNLWGAHRTGKTRTLLLVLKHQHFLGHSIKFFGPDEFAKQCEMRDFKSARWLKGLEHLDILAFDDIDKCKMTKVQEDKFFALLDARIRNRKPIFFTGNTRGGELQTMFRNGAAIVGRMREFCVSIHFPAQQELPLK